MSHKPQPHRHFWLPPPLRERVNQVSTFQGFMVHSTVLIRKERAIVPGSRNLACRIAAGGFMFANAHEA